MSLTPDLSSIFQSTYWCHSCDLSITLPPTTTAIICPLCHGDSLEHMDTNIEDIDVIDRYPGSPLTNLTPAEYFLPTSPFFHRLINHLTAETFAAAPEVTNPRSTPASKSAIDSLPEVRITPETETETEFNMICPVCKDPFVVDSLTKLMPCNHLYHSNCIVPWLEINNSCPVCRVKLPVGEKGLEIENVGFNETELNEFRNSLRYREFVSEGNLISPTQNGEVGRGGGVLERENSVETVSSCPRLQVEEGVGGGGGGSDDVGGALART